MKRKINLLLVSVSFSPESGLGLVEHGVRLYKGLKKYSKEVNVQARSLFGDKIFYAINKKMRNKYPVKIETMDKKRNKPDIIHYLSPGIFMSNSVIRLFSNEKAKQVVTIHDLDAIKKVPKIGVNNYINKELSKGPMKIVNRFLNYMENRGIYLTVKKADHILCVSDLTKNDLIETFHVNPNRISVIYNVIGKEFRKTKKKSNKKIVIGHLSSYAYNKNVEVLINAFKKVKSDKFELHLYGASMPFDISDDKRIKYFGHAEDTVKMYNSFDVFAFPSKWEGFGMPVMEAKSCMVPVITYKNGQLPDVVKRNTCQFKTEEDLTEIIEKTAWKKIDIKAAYSDTKECREEYVIKKSEEMYRKVLEVK